MAAERDPAAEGPGLQRRQALLALGALGALTGAAVAGGCAQSPGLANRPSPALDSLSRISLASLRQRGYDARLQLEDRVGDNAWLSYRSDSLKVYARVVVPPPIRVRPAAGWPVIVHAHGWVGEQGAVAYRFGVGSADSMSGLLDRFVQAGYVVVVPGFRGHGTVRGMPAEGLEWIQTYDNGSYLSPIFYAVDLLHALQSLATLDQAVPGLRVDPRRLYLTGHSQGGDVALTALAVSSSPALPLQFAAASIWAGCFEGRIEQGRFYGAMEASADALKDPRFMPVMPSWWKPSMYTGSIEQGQLRRQQQMYDTVRRTVADQADAHPQTRPLDTAMAALDAIKHPQHVRAPLHLHCSDMDHYSPPAWNETLARGVQAAGGRARVHLHAGNSHSFQVESGWSPAGARPGLATIATQCLELFA